MWNKLISALSKLQLVTFAILLGAGMIVTSLSAWIIFIIAYIPWPDSVASDRIHALAIALWIVLGLVGLIVVSLAFGKIEKLSVTGGVVSGELQFENDDEHKEVDK